MDKNRLLISLKNDNDNRRGFVTVVHPDFQEGRTYNISQGEKPASPKQSLFNDKVIIEGIAQEKEIITEFTPQFNYNY